MAKKDDAKQAEQPEHSAEDLQRCPTCMLPRMNCRCEGHEPAPIADPAPTFEVGLPNVVDPAAKKD